MLGNGSHGIQVPDLGALNQQSPAEWVQHTVLTHAGITRGGSGTVIIEPGEQQFRLSNVDLMVMWVPPMIHIVSVVGRTAAGPVVIPWHAVRSLSGP